MYKITAALKRVAFFISTQAVGVVFAAAFLFLPTPAAAPNHPIMHRLYSIFIIQSSYK
jgi:hypothetical protein